jgi:DNA repair protein RadC
MVSGMPKNVNLGHRKRLKERFLKSELRSLPDYEILELLLFYIVPIKDTKLLAKQLIFKFGSLPNLLNAEHHELKQIDGVGESIIGYLKLLLDFYSRLHLPCTEDDRQVLNNWSAVINYCNLTMGFQNNESFKILYLNSKNTLIKEDTISLGTVDRIVVYPREIVKNSLSYSAVAVILIHNHPSGDVNPSKQDIQLTKKIIEALGSVNIVVHDHVIVSKNNYYSFRSNNL